MKKIKINILLPVWIGVAIWLCAIGYVSWWVAVLILASHFELSFTLARKRF